MTELSFFINGARYPQHKMVGSATNFDEFFTETCLSDNALAKIHNSHINNTAPLLTPIAQAVATGTGANDAAEAQATANGATNLLRNQVPVNCINYEYLAGKLAASFNASPTVGSAILDKFNGSGAAAATSRYGTLLVPYWFGKNFKTPAKGSGLYSGTATLGSTDTFEMYHSDAVNKAAGLFFYAECGKILSADPLTLNFVVRS